MLCDSQFSKVKSFTEICPLKGLTDVPHSTCAVSVDFMVSSYVRSGYRAGRERMACAWQGEAAGEGRLASTVVTNTLLIILFLLETNSLSSD